MNLIMLWGCFSGVGLGQLHLIKTIRTILCFKIYGSSLWKALFCSSMPVPRCTKQGPERHGLGAFRDLSVEELHWVAQSADLNRIVHLWDTLDCKSGPVLQHHYQTSKCLGILDEWVKIPTHILQNLAESLPGRVTAFITAKEPLI